ncbi:MAG: exonuclease domain-containing protein, partial [Candidatus Gracilibacteria bacterium]|nr:exonuclease domain-containing protein [Candidatus Gracilibacteria bacterium]
MFVSLDLETTGIDPTKNRIIEFGAIKFDLEGHTEKTSFLINPGIALPQIITHITNITDDDLKNQPPLTEKIEEIKEFIGDLPIIGHNIQFDTSFLKAAGIELKNQEYDTFGLAGILLPNLPSYSLEILSDVLDLQHKEKHRALDDSIAAMELFIKLIRKFESLSKETIEEIQEIAKKSNWKLKDFILSLSPKEFKEPLIHTPKSFESKPENEEIAKTITNSPSALFEIAPPYDELIPSLLKFASKNSYICLDYELFNSLAPSIPEEIAQLDTPKNYISQKRLSELKNKTFLEEYEATALIKFLIWIKTTKTGLLREVSLFGVEKSVIYQVSSDPELTDISQEPFVQKALQKDQTSPAICSFEYLMDKSSKKIRDLILIDFERFTKSLFSKHSLHINPESLLYPLNSLKESTPENKTIESLIGKSSILFGLLGLIFEKYNNQDSYNPRMILTPEIQNTKEWQDANASLNNLISISQELGEILGPKTQGHLHKWKKKLIELKSIFENPDLYKFLIFIEIDWNKNCTLQKMPISLKEAISETLENCENYKLIDQCIDLNDEGKFAKSFYGLPEELKMIKTNVPTKNPIIKIVKQDESP